MKLFGIEAAARVVARLAPATALIVTLQNGIGIAERIAPHLPDREVLSGIVGFNVANTGPGRYAKATRGEVYARAHPKLDDLGFSLVPDMRPVQWGKLILNLNNAIAALSGLPLRAELSRQGYRRVYAAAIEEALAVCAVLGIVPTRLSLTAPRLIPPLQRMPDWLFNTTLLPLLGISPSARLSMSADYDSGRLTEVRDLNGAVSVAGKKNGIPTPVNDALVELVEARRGHFDPLDLQREVGL
jgi:2-dehydropantoate 2-reductase